jgi:hypothetical protein
MANTQSLEPDEAARNIIEKQKLNKVDATSV